MKKRQVINRIVVALMVTLVLQTSSSAHADCASFRPRFALLAGYPEIVAGTAGTWVLPMGEPGVCRRFVGDVRVGVSGVTGLLGAGIASGDDSRFEKGWSLGAQGSVTRSWPGWSFSLSPATTYAGTEIFAGIFAFRCSAGFMLSVIERPSRERVFSAACGIGTP